MAMIRCPECRREVSDRANSCPSCGSPIGGGNNLSGNIAFERRIEEYKKNGYLLVKNKDNTATLSNYKMGVGGWLIALNGGIVLAILILNFIYNYGLSKPSIFILVSYGFATTFWATKFYLKRNKKKTEKAMATISLINGRIQETGNVLKK